MAVLQKHHNVNVWWFPQDFCQSRYGEYYESGTNSCTLISLILADKMAKEEVFHKPSKTLPKRAIEIFGDAMNEGNIVYGRMFNRGSKRKTPNLNIPEALTALCDQRNMSFDLREWFYTHLTANPHKESYQYSVPNRITQVLKLGVQLFKQPPSNSRARNLFAALIADSRTTVFVFEFPQNVVSFFDSHQHGQRAGAVVAQASIDNLAELSVWFVNMLQEVYKSRPSVYEISFLTTRADAPNLETPI
ncbi:uncharacterized protein LOC111687731 [Lucilia cuprina]|uniref:uncharacterized protein LOC111687731 n=1 Tax=Lucilia cuprina TaxID=7375 RepID=UPI001F058B79|nr:uncharacterized protein LOC111687731 [Lucilia cuprina]